MSNLTLRKIDAESHVKIVSNFLFRAIEENSPDIREITLRIVEGLQFVRASKLF
jgi:hypothetical protein